MAPPAPAPLAQYGALVIVDSEEEFYPEEIAKLEDDVATHGLGEGGHGMAGCTSGRAPGAAMLGSSLHAARQWPQGRRGFTALCCAAL